MRPQSSTWSWTSGAQRYSSGSRSNARTSASSFAAATYLSDDGFAEVFTAHDNHVTLGGQFFPNGLAGILEQHAVGIEALKKRLMGRTEAGPGQVMNEVDEDEEEEDDAN